jgi:uncharacterized membrane protein
MSEDAIPTIEQTGTTVAKPAILAAVVSLIGLADAAYLTAKHYTGKNVPCNIISGCEQVLNSQYAEILGIPTAAFGVISYFLVFSLAILTFYGNYKMWNLFGGLVSGMAIFTIWLIYLQAYVIGAFCQFCLISAATTITLLIIFIVSKTLLKK